MAKKVTLKDKDDVVLYPQTVADAVYNSNGDAVEDLVGKYEDSEEYLQATIDAQGHLLMGIRTNGEVHVPILDNPVVKYISEDIISYFSAEDNPEWLQVTVDKEGKVVEGIRRDGKKVVNVPVKTPNDATYYIENPEWLELKIDRTGKIVEGVKTTGKYIGSLHVDDATGDSLTVNKHLTFSNEGYKNVQTDFGLAYSDWRVPAYYNSGSYLSKKERIISNLIRATIIDGDAFYFVTDTHWEYNQKHSPAIIKQMNRKLNIPRLFHGGDMYHVGISYDGYNIDCPNAYRGAMDNPNKVYIVDGNHEYIAFDSISATYGDVFAESRIFLDDVVYGGSNKNYYYVDNVQKKIRYINLYSWGEYSGSEYVYGFEDNNQMQWLSSVALAVDPGWKIIIFSHGVTWYSYMRHQIGHVQGYDNLRNIVNNYQGNGDIVAVICGHSHSDTVALENNIACPVIVTTCDQNYPFSYQYIEDGQQKTYTEFSELYEERQDGTVNEQAFDVVVYDKENEVIHLCRIGSRAMNMSNSFLGDAQVDFRSVFTKPIHVAATKSLSSVLTGNLSWRSSDTDVISVEDGAIVANAAGDAVITATNSSGEAQSFFIKVI